MILGCYEKEQYLAEEGQTCGDRAAFFCEKEPQHNTLQVQEWVVGSGHGQQGGIKTTKVLRSISENTWEKGLHMITNLQGKHKPDFWVEKPLHKRVPF